MNIRDAFNGYNINVPTYFSGKLMTYNMMKVDDFKIAKEYIEDLRPKQTLGPQVWDKLTRNTLLFEKSDFFVS